MKMIYSTVITSINWTRSPTEKREPKVLKILLKLNKILSKNRYKVEKNCISV